MTTEDFTTIEIDESVVCHVTDTVSSEAEDGLKLFVQQWKPTTTTTTTAANLILVHGYLEHSGRYAEFAKYIVMKSSSRRQPIVVTAYDLRGHGQSDGRRAYVSTYQDYHHDLESVLLYVKGQQPHDSKSIPSFVLGHSNGGMVASLHYACDFANDDDNNNNNNKKIVKNNPIVETATPIDGLILVSSFIAPADELSWIKVLLAQFLGYLLPKLSLDAELDTNNLMHDTRKRQDHKNDKQVQSHFTLGWGRLSMTEQAKAQHITQVKVPALLYIYATHDKVANPTKLATQSQRIEPVKNKDGIVDKTVLVRKGEYHEVLNEIQRQETYDAILEWIQKRI